MTEEITKKFGTFKGLFIPNVTMMFGVILFLRVSLVVGNVGLIEFGAIVALSLTLMLITSFSIASIVTNMDVGSGGVYYLISRSLGIEAGGAIGLLLYVSQLISLVLCVSGFAYSLNTLFPDFSVMLIEVATMVFLAILSFVSTDFALRTQGFIFVVLMGSIATIAFGASPAEASQGTPFFPGGLSFWQGFAIFYPAMTGIEAGMAMSGCLKNPARSFTVGNPVSLVFTGIIYSLVASFLYFYYPTSLLQNSSTVVIDFNSFPSIIYLGIFCATISSALGNFLGAPRMLQSISEDGITPGIFANTFGSQEEPRYATAFTFFIGLVLLVSTNMDQIIPILSMICLLSYGTLNLVAALSELIHPPSWRPAIHTHWIVSLIGFSLCLICMLMIEPGWTLFAIALLLGIYLYINSMNIESSFEDLRDNFLFYFSRQALYRLSESGDHPIHWHPQLLIFTGAPTQQENMIHFGHSLTRRSGVMTLSTILPGNWEDEYSLKNQKSLLESYLEKNRLHGLAEVFASEDQTEGMIQLLKAYGIGPIQPNTLLFGFPSREESYSGLLKINEAAELFKKNVLLFIDTPDQKSRLFSRGFPGRKKRIDVWWDNQYRGNFELMLSFIHTLISSRKWKNAHVNLKACVHSDSAKENMEEYFSEYIEKSRVKVHPKVYLEEDCYDPMDYVHKYSQKTDLIFHGLRPVSDFEEESEYLEYLHESRRKLGFGKPLIFLTCYDDIDHKEIYI